MKKNRMMRLASVMLVAVLMTTCTISGTFAKYVTSVESQDSARVAKWGFEPVAMDIADLFDDAYDLPAGGVMEVDSADDADVIAPGTWGEETFAFAYDETTGAQAPEVAYTFTVDVSASTCHETIQNNKNIIWYLDNVKAGTNGTWTELLDAIKLLSGEADGSADYLPGALPAKFTASDDVHTVSWKWLFGTEAESYTGTYTVGGVPMTQDEYDTWMGNADNLAEVELVISITATQID